MELRELQSLVRLAKTNSIHKTAQEVNLSPGAVHKQLKSLEFELGVKLYEKRDGSLHLTRAGELVLPYVQELLAQRDAVSKAVQDWKSSAFGTVRVGAGPAFASTMLPSILRQFSRKHPGVELYVEVGSGDDLLQGLRDGMLDLSFDLNSGLRQQADLAVSASWSCPLAIISAMPSVPLRCAMKDLEQVPFILFAEKSRIEAVIDHYFDACQFRPKVVMRSDSAEAIKAMVLSGLGIGMTFLWSSHEGIRSGQLRKITTDKPALLSRMSLMKRNDSYTPKVMSSFIQIARAMNLPHMTLEKS